MFSFSRFLPPHYSQLLILSDVFFYKKFPKKRIRDNCCVYNSTRIENFQQIFIKSLNPVRVIVIENIFAGCFCLPSYIRTMQIVHVCVLNYPPGTARSILAAKAM